MLYPWHGCFQVFGRIRSLVLAKTPLNGAFWSSGRVLLGSLFLFRRHARQSTTLDWQPYALMAWCAPETQGKTTVLFWSE